MITTSSSNMAVNPVRTIGAFTPQIVISEQHTDELVITEFPVEDGASISDHAYKKSPRVTITAAVGKSEENPDLTQVYEQLQELQESRQPFEVLTGKRRYQSMLIELLSVETDKTKEHVLWFEAVCKYVNIVSLKKNYLAAT